MKKAWIENNTIRDICHGNPDELYHPDVAKFYTEDVPDDAANGDGWDGSKLTKPVIVVPEQDVLPRTISLDDIRNNLTLSEKVKWDNDSSPEIKTVKLEFASPRSVEDTTELLTFLVESGVISQASVDKILS